LEIAASHGWSIDSIDVFEMSPDEKDLKPEAPVYGIQSF
jgi:hypothetical protein